jgi:hypothetical protein
MMNQRKATFLQRTIRSQAYRNRSPPALNRNVNHGSPCASDAPGRTLCSNDAQSNYDHYRSQYRVPIYAWTVPVTTNLRSMFETLQKRPTSSYDHTGISEQTYGTDLATISELLGRNGAGPAIWAVISTVIII